VTTPLHRLFVRKLTSVGLVEAGDNPAAKVMLFKRKPAKPPTAVKLPQPVKTTLEPPEGRTNGGGLVDTLDLSSLDDETAAPIKAHVAGLEKAAADAATRVAALEAQLDVDDGDEKLPDDLPDVVKARLDTQTSAIAKAEARADALEARLAKAEDERLTERYTERAAKLQVLLGDSDEMAPVLKDLAAGAPEAYARLDAQFDTLLNMQGFDALLKEYGDSAATGSAVDQIAAYAVEIRKADPDLSRAEAKAEAWREHPELKQQAREEG